MRLPKLRSTAVAIVLTLAVSRVTSAAFSGTDLFLPMAGRQAGVYPSNWYTTVWIYNPGAEATTARVYFLERNTANPTPPWVDVAVGPGATEKLDNVVETYFHVQAFGALRVTCQTQRLVVTSRVYSSATGAGERDSVGQDFAGVPAAFAIGAGERAQVVGVHQTVPASASECRFNYGFVETTGHAATVRVRVLDENGTELASEDIGVREYSQRQVAFKDHFPDLSTTNARIEAEVVSGAGRVIAYGSMVANGTQDPTTLEMTYPMSALGTAAVEHDATLVGDGTAAAPLGVAPASVTADRIAPAAVTPGKIEPSTTPGQVLVTMPAGAASAGAAEMSAGGPAVGWASPGLLPLSLTSGGVTFGGPTGALAQDPPNLFWDDGWNRLGIGTDSPKEQLSLTGNLRLPETSASGGRVFVGDTPFLHDYRSGTFVGRNAGNLTYTGSGQTAVGSGALTSLTSGNYNTALGTVALTSLTTGSSNVALGWSAAMGTTTGHANVAIGAHALETNTTGGYNVVVGYDALHECVTGSDNVAVGRSAMLNTTTGSSNVAVGTSSLPVNSSGLRNTALGHAALSHNTTGDDNIAIGREAGRELTTGDWNIDIGHAGVAGESGTIRLGFSANHTRTFLAGVYGTTTGQPGAVPVVIDFLGQLGTVSSSARYKQNVQEMGDASDPIFALRPVTFELIEQPGPRHFGLIAEEVAEVLPELVALGPDGRPETVLYHDLPSLLLNELQKQRRTIDELAATVAALSAEVAALRASRPAGR